MRFRLLGTVEADLDGVPVVLGWRQERCLLALLLLEVGRSVPLERLAELMWEGEPPDDSRRALQVAGSRLRARLNAAGAGEHGVRLLTHGGGFAVAAPPEDVDVHRFRQLVGGARTAGDPHRSAALLREALLLWRGPALADVAGDRLRQSVCVPLEEQRLTAVEELMELELAAGRHHEVAGELTGLVAEHPARERLRGQLMLAYYRAGRQKEALETYRDLRRELSTGFGLEPGGALRELQQRILTNDTSLGVAGPEPAADAAAPVPRELPPAVPGFVAREAEMSAMDDALSIVDTSPTLVVSGTAGVGKTSLAVQWAHRVAGRFPDGQFYVNLRGFDPGRSPVDASEALRGFLRGVGVTPQRMPDTQASLTALWRTLLADRRVLIVLDNARDAEQVRPLLPGGAGCLTLVTSRNRLAGLVAADGARSMPLDLLSPADARELLARRIGDARVAAEPGPAGELVELSAGLALALAIIAARAAMHPHFSLAEVAGQARGRSALCCLSSASGGDDSTDVRAVFSWSYEALSPAAAEMFGLLGLHPGPDIDAVAAANLAGVTAGRAAAILDELASAHLVHQATPGRYAFHDLLRAYAVELAEAMDTEEKRWEAVRRVLDYYVHAGCHADRVLFPHRDLTRHAAAPHLAHPRLSDPDSATVWFAAERPVLLACLDHAPEAGFTRYAWLLARVIESYLDRCGLWHELHMVEAAGLAAARRLGDASAQAASLVCLAVSHGRMGRHDRAAIACEEALELYLALGDPVGEAQARVIVGLCYERSGDYERSLGYVRQAHELYRRSGNLSGQARTLNAIAWDEVKLGDAERALEHCAGAIRLQRRLGDQRGEAFTLTTKGMAHVHMGQFARAQRYYKKALEIHEATGDRFYAAVVWAHMGDAHAGNDLTEAAAQAWQRALEIYEDLDHPDAKAVRAKLNELG